MAIAGMVLCGGESRRMGRSKAWLDFHGEPMLCRVVRTVTQAVSPVIVVAAPNQSLPELPDNVIIARDPIEHAGPLVGLTAGLELVPTLCTHVFVTACDSPFLTAKLIRLMTSMARPDRLLVPLVNNRRQPLPAVYPTSILPIVHGLSQAGNNSLRSIWNVTAVDEVSEVDVKSVDPLLIAFRPMNDPIEYDAALAFEDSTIPLSHAP